jgi:hypothetical protein
MEVGCMISYFGGINNSQINDTVLQVMCCVEVGTFTDICEEFIVSCLRVEAQNIYSECGYCENHKSLNLEEFELKNG